VTSRFLNALPPLLVAAILSSCATVEQPDQPETGEAVSIEDSRPAGDLASEDPETLIQSGKLIDAAMIYLRMANRAEAPEKQSIQLRAINLLLNADHFDIAGNLLEEIRSNELNSSQLTHYAYLNARMAIYNRNAKESMQWLDYVRNEDYSAFASEANILKLIITSHELAGETVPAMLKRIQLDELLDSGAEVSQNQQAIMRGFPTLSADTLKTMAQSADSRVVRGWIEISQLVSKTKNPFRLGTMLQTWREQNPDHPIRQEILAALAPQESDEPTKLENIALLLPLTSSYAKPAAAIRDGFLASYYSLESGTDKPIIRVYDTGPDAKTILAVYQQAKDDGADIIVGPLRKEAVEILASGTNHNIPVLALNQLEDTNFYSNNFYQFSLSPEDEARQAAQRAWQNGLNHAAIIYPDSKWGKRVADAFKIEWEKQEGVVVSETQYDSRKNDFSKPIKQLLAIDKSHKRKNDLAALLRTRFKFEPRRRQDIDFIFMAAFPRQARLIPPQLNFYHATDIPIYATSHSFSGEINVKKDRDLDSVFVGDMPWTLTTAKNDSIKQQVYRNWPNKLKQFNRLYALGADSYNILFYLNWLRSNSDARLQGATGVLHMNGNNQVQRQLTWAEFKKGRPKLLANTVKIEPN